MKYATAVLITMLTAFAAVACATNGATQQMTDAATSVQTEVPFAIVYRAGPAWRRGVPMEQQGLRDHFFYLRALDQKDRIILAGPAGPTGGIVLLLARDQEEADGLAAADPAVIAGVFVAEVHRFVPRFVGRNALVPVAP